jgi:hypothetical protein
MSRPPSEAPESNRAYGDEAPLADEGEVILFPDSNHGSHFQFTERFNRYATDFLER